MNIDTSGLDKSTSVLLVKREVDRQILSYLKNTLGKQGDLECVVQDDFDERYVAQIFDKYLPEDELVEGKNRLICDMIDLSKSFFHSTKSKHIKLQLEVVDSDKCRFFHEDKMRQRLLCTYLGPGTEWLDNSNVDRSGLCKGNNDKVVINYEKVNKAKPFEILLLRGALFDDSGLGDVHRSPPVEAEKKSRIVLKVDECY